MEETRFEGFKALEKPIHKCSVAAVIKNPYAGIYVEDLSELTEYGEYLGGYLTDIAVNLLDAPVHNYGKGAIIGLNGELEHGGAILHPKLSIIPKSSHLTNHSIRKKDRRSGYVA
jgi:hypothetical protein